MYSDPNNPALIRGWRHHVVDFTVACFAVAILLSVVLGFVALHVFIVLALAGTNNDNVRAACGEAGEWVWSLVLAQPLVFWFFVVLFGGFTPACETHEHTTSQKEDAARCYNCTFWIYGSACFVMFIAGLMPAIGVRSNAACVDSLRSNSFGMERALLIDLFDCLHWTNCGVAVLAALHMVVKCCDRENGEVRGG